MKVKATFHHVIAVTREVDVDEEAFREWARRKYRYGYDQDIALACWIDEQVADDGELFSDWRSDRPLPDDFEFQYSEVIDATPALPDTKEER